MIRRKPTITIISIVTLILASFLAGGLGLIVGIITLTLILLYPILRPFYRSYYQVHDTAKAVFAARTSDGWTLPMHYHEAEDPVPGALPVIFCHGIAVNKWGVDLDEKHSLSVYLREKGFPVFTVSIRGTGLSKPPKDYDGSYTFDDVVEKDVPAFIETALRLTRAPGLIWIGHSMGGMIGAAYLGRQLPGYEKVQSYISLGGPGKVDYLNSEVWQVLYSHSWLNDILDWKAGSRILAPVGARLPTPVEQMLYSKNNLTGLTVRKLMVNAVENINPGLGEQFLEWINKGEEISKTGFHYRNGYRNIKIPCLFLAGSDDHIVPPHVVRFAYDRTASKKKKFLSIGKLNGSTSDYCHLGLVVGEHASEDVFPHVYSFIKQYGIKKRSRFAKFRRKATSTLSALFFTGLLLTGLSFPESIAAEPVDPTVSSGPQCRSGFIDQEQNPTWLLQRLAYRRIFQEPSRRPFAVMTGESTAALFSEHAMQRYMPDFHIVNRGIPGETTVLMLTRLEEDVLSLRPKVIIMAIGGNDILGGRCITNSVFNVNLILAIIRNKLPDTEVILVGVPPVLNAAANVVSPYYNLMLRTITMHHRQVRYMDLWEILGDFDNNRLKDEYIITLPDGRQDAVHFNEAGYAAWAEKLIPILEEIKE